MWLLCKIGVTAIKMSKYKITLNAQVKFSESYPHDNLCLLKAKEKKQKLFDFKCIFWAFITFNFVYYCYLDEWNVLRHFFSLHVSAKAATLISF